MSDSVVKKQIPANVNDIVVFVHGFGSRWDARGMFTEISASLPANWGSVLFDLYEVKEPDVYVQSVADQVGRLKEIISETQKENPNATIHIIAHSKGCIVTAIAKPEIAGKIILLAPPESFGIQLQEYFERYSNATKTESEIIVPRKDGTTTHIPLNYFKESQEIDAQGVMLALSQQHPFTLVQTLNDEVIGDTSYEQLQNNKSIAIKQINSDHNFTAISRGELIKLIKDILK